MPFFWITLSLIAGIVIAASWQVPGVVWYFSCLIFTIACCVIFLVKPIRLILKEWPVLRGIPGTRLPLIILPAIIFFGGSLYHHCQPDPERSIYSENDSGRVLQIAGMVASPPDVREKLTLVEFRASSYVTDGDLPTLTNERMMVFLPADETVHYGETLHLRGKVITPRESADFSYRDYLAGQGIFSQMLYPEILSRRPSQGGVGVILFAFKEKSLRYLDQIYPAPESALVKGVLLGDDGDIPDNINEAFQQSGTSHLIAISGFNIAIVANLVIWFFSFALGKFRGAAVATIAIILYTILVGANPPVVRAAIMGTISIFGSLIGRRNGGMNALFLTSGVMLAANPFLLWSISFQLSAGATLGLVLFAGPIENAVTSVVTRLTILPAGKTIGQKVSEYVFFTLAAQIPIFPILLRNFHQVPLATFIANPLVLPFQPLLMVSSATAMALAWMHPVLGELAAKISLPFISLTIRVVEWAAGLPIPSIAVPTLSFGLVAAWILVITLPAALPRLKDWLQKTWKPVIIIGGMGLTSIAAIHLATDRPDGLTHVYISGGAEEPIILVQESRGRSFLVNAGRSQNALLSFLDQRLPFGNRQVDLVLLRPNKVEMEIVDAVAVIIPIKEVGVITNLSDSSSTMDVDASNFRLINLPSGGQFITESGMTVNISQPQENGFLTDIRWKNLDLQVFSGQTKSQISCRGGLLILAGKGIPISDACQPQVLISPDIATWRTNQLDLYQTGWIHLYSDGTNLWIESQK